MISIMMFFAKSIFERQVLCHLTLTSVVICYVALNKPFEDRYLNSKEIANETLIALACYPLWIYSDWVSNERDRIFAGWALIGIIAFIILFNLCFMACN